MSICEGTVVTSRIRLARNVAGYNFKSRLFDKQKADEIIYRTYACAKKYAPFKLYEISKISPLEARCLKETYVISEALRTNSFSGAAAALDDGSLTVMINEEDHVREQALEKGFALKKAYMRLAPLDSWLNKNLRFCRDDRWGYLTACPTNLGTGLRASVMMFLPALTRTDKIGALAEHAKAAGLTVRGAFGEGSDGDGYMYQVSNEITLGKTEERIINEVQSFIEYAANLEQTNAIVYYNQFTREIDDEVFRAYGILSNCRIIDFSEFSALIASLKMGVMLGVIKASEVSALDDLLVTSRPAVIAKRLGLQNESVDNGLIDEFRADYSRECVKKIILP